MEERLELKQIERSLIKTYRKDIWAKFVRASVEYKLIEENDKIAVAISGGKDSLILAKLIQELQRINVVSFDVEFIVMDPGFSKENLDSLIDNCAYLNIPIKIKKSNVFDVSKKLSSTGKPCYMCARMRRGFLYEFARELGCNKLALGHHFNDVIETIMLNVLYAGSYKTMVPKVKSMNFEGITLIRPLYLIKEKDIIRWAKNAHLKTMNCGCEVAKGEIDSKRKEIKELIASLKEKNDNVDYSIFRSAENVSLGALLGYKKGEEKIDFLQIFDEEE